jgi:hypothetical protein
MSALATRPSDAGAELDRLAENGALDDLWWALTGVLLSAAQRLAPEATTPAEAAWIVAGRSQAEPIDTPSAGPSRPLRAGVRSTQQDDRVSCPGKLDAVAEEDSRHEPTSTAGQF